MIPQLIKLRDEMTKVQRDIRLLRVIVILQTICLILLAWQVE